jgi:hypothetical protein
VENKLNLQSFKLLPGVSVITTRAEVSKSHQVRTALAARSFTIPVFENSTPALK